MPDPVFILDNAPDGIVATHPARLELPVLVAPIPAEDKATKFNTVRPPLVVIGCMRLHKTGFEFDSSFVGRNSELRFVAFAKMMQGLRKQDDQNPQRFPPCAVFGHADPTGTDSYNKTLAGRRALAVYAVLVRDPSIWEALFSVPLGHDNWGNKAIQTMLSVSLKRGPKGEPVTPAEPPFYTGPIDGGTPQSLPATRAAVLAYEAARKLPAGFPPGPAVRKQLFLEYMDVICHDSSGQRFQLDPKTDFIARRKDGKGLKGDVMGCGDFNPTFRLSKDKEDLAKKDAVLAQVRNDIYLVDRRALVYVFRHGTEIDPGKWPCPRASEGPGDCTIRFWSDGDKRRRAGPDDRTFGEKMTLLELDDSNNLTVHPVEETGNLMACRFYHAFAVHSPCEVKVKEWVIRFRVDTPKGQRVLANRRYVVKLGEAEFSPIIRGSTDDFGFVKIPVVDERTKMLIKLDAAKDLTDDEDGDSGSASGNGGSSAPAAAPPNVSAGQQAPQSGAGANADPGPDPEAFPDEDQFIPMVLDGGALHPRDAADDLAVKQRLYNLGFGEDPPEKWTPQEFDFAFRAFKHRRNLDSADDDAVRQAIFKEHDLSGGPAPVPEDSSAALSSTSSAT